VNALLIDLDVARLSPGLLEERLRAQGFEHIEHAEVIPGITRSLTAVTSSTGHARPANGLAFGNFARIFRGAIPQLTRNTRRRRFASTRKPCRRVRNALWHAECVGSAPEHGANP
jgi:hypothetical protein